MTIFANGRIVTPGSLLEVGWVEVIDEQIVGVGLGQPAAGTAVDVDLAGRTLVPGFVDQHCHGGGGASFVTDDSEQALIAAKAQLAHGTTSIVGSLVTGSERDLTRQIETLKPLVDDGVLVGIHLEGPWISADHCGAHDTAQLRAPDAAEVDRLLRVGDGRIAMVTIAPELPGAIPAIERIVASGAVAAIGHSDADYDTGVRAIEAGARVATHVMNAMRPLHHREPGATGALLEDPRVDLELIADGTHLHPAVLRIVMREAGIGRVSLVTDAMAAAGAQDGHYLLGELEVNVLDGVARLVEGGAIAGSTLTMDAALRYAVLTVGLPLVEVSTMLSANPARVLGLTDRGSVAVGKRADLVVLTPDLEVGSVMRAGRWV